MSDCVNSKTLDSFLSRVDEINDIIKDLCESDGNGSKDAVQRADAYIKREQDAHKDTGFNRTVINKAAFTEGTAQLNTGSHVTDGMSKDAFCAAIERDAEERAARRKERMLVATRCKEEGNSCFKLGKYEDAVDAYTRGLAEIRDFKELYTNRAQAYLKLARFKEALEDCDWALKVQEKNAKAHVLRGRAYHSMGKFDSAIESYNQAIQFEPDKETVIKGYVQEAVIAKAAAELDKQAAELLAAGAEQHVGVAQVMQKVKDDSSPPAYYAAALRVLDTLIVDDEHKALFRTEGGFDVIKSHRVISRCLNSAPKDLSVQEIAVSEVFITVLAKVCDRNEASQLKFLSMAGCHDMLLRFVDPAKQRQHPALQLAAYHLLGSCCSSEAGLKKLIANLDCSSLQKHALATLIEFSHQSSSSQARQGPELCNTIIELLEKLARHDRFRKKVSTDMDHQVLGSFTGLLNTSKLREPILSIMTNLCAEPVARDKLARSADVVGAVLRLLHPAGKERADSLSAGGAAMFAEMTVLALGLLLNLTLVTSAPPLDSAAGTLCRWCLRACAIRQPASAEGEGASVHQRALGLLGRVLRPRHDLATLLAREGLQGGSQSVFSCIAPHLSLSGRNAAATVKSALTALACFTANGDIVRQEVLSDSKAMAALFGLLSSDDESVIGNAALCLTHCLSLRPAAMVTDTVRRATSPDILKTLLPWARDARKDDVRQNCAILVARLTQVDNEYLQQLRQLEGLGILHSCMKLVQ